MGRRERGVCSVERTWFAAPCVFLRSVTLLLTALLLMADAASFAYICGQELWRSSSQVGSWFAQLTSRLLRETM